MKISLNDIFLSLNILNVSLTFEIPRSLLEGSFQTFSQCTGTLATMELCHRPGRILTTPIPGLACMETRLLYCNVGIFGGQFCTLNCSGILETSNNVQEKNDIIANISSRIPSMCVKLGPSLARQAALFLLGERHIGSWWVVAID